MKLYNMEVKRIEEDVYTTQWQIDRVSSLREIAGKTFKTMEKPISLILLLVTLIGCTNFEQKETNHLKQEGKIMSNNDSKIFSFMTFQEANAEEAMNFYVELFDNSKIIEVQKYQKGDPGPEGTIKMAKFVLDGSPFICSDSFIKHAWNFTPAISLYKEVETEQELIRLFEKLSEGGNVLMPLENYGFSTKFGFVEDRFGLSWQLNLK